MTYRIEKEKRYNEILDSISNYLLKFKNSQNFNNPEMEKEYSSFIEQDVEKLMELNNSGIINIDLFEKIKITFKNIILLLEGEDNKKSGLSHIIYDLYINFKYVIENILFMIENECLVGN
jgi:hypothetical protein